MTIEMILRAFEVVRDGKSNVDDPLHVSIIHFFEEAGTRGLTAHELVEVLLGRKLTLEEEDLVLQQTDGCQTAPGSVLKAFALSTPTVPTADEIEAVILDLIRVQDGLADGPKFEELWWSEAFDPQGKSQAYGLGVTHTDARAHAWISVWWEGYDAREALYLVPPLVSEGWRFEIYPPGGPMFQLGGADAREVDPSSEH
jgi:hypothetical protein